MQVALGTPANQSLIGKLAPCTIFHCARALYEADATSYWLMQDVYARWPRMMK